MTRKGPLLVERAASVHTVKELLRAGTTPSRLRARDVRTRAMHGVVVHPESGHELTSVEGRCRAVATILKPGQFISRRSAALLWGLPVEEDRERRIDVGSPHPVKVPERPQVIGHRTQAGRLRIVKLHGMPVASPEDAWCLMAPVVSLEELVIAGDALLTGKRQKGGRRQPLCSTQQLHETIAQHRGTPGAKKRQRAAKLLRFPVDSPQETRTRLLLLREGFPEPIVNCPVTVETRMLHADLGYPAQKIAIEYEGRYHFTGGERQAVIDVERWEAMTHAGWRVIRVTRTHLMRPDQFLQRLSVALAERA